MFSLRARDDIFYYFSISFGCLYQLTHCRNVNVAEVYCRFFFFLKKERIFACAISLFKSIVKIYESFSSWSLYIFIRVNTLFFCPYIHMSNNFVSIFWLGNFMRLSSCQCLPFQVWSIRDFTFLGEFKQV